MPKLKNLIGQKFNFLLVIDRAANSSDKRTMWKCICDCGNIVSVRSDLLKSGNNKSCGCYHKKFLKTHGFKGSPEYSSWQGMKTRCTNSKAPNYKIYGNRGIKVCKQWINSFENFLADMGLKPSPTHSIDRIDNNGDYTPDNCKWSTRIDQGNNKRANKYITYKEETLTYAQWGRRIGINPNCLGRRFYYGWPVEKIIETPIRKHIKH